MDTHLDRARAPSASPYLAVPMKFALSRLAEARWESGPAAGLEQRDLLLEQASSGQMGAVHMRATAPGRLAGWNAARFRLLYVIRGELSVAVPGETVTLLAGDTATASVLAAARDVSWDGQFEAVEVFAPARGGVSPVPLLDFGPSPSAPMLAGVTRDRPDAYQVGNGPRRFFEYRDLGTADATGRRVHLHQVRVVEAAVGGTGWHIHSMSQLFFVFRGWVDISVEDQGTFRMVAGDAMCIAADMRHNVSSFSLDYDLIELCLPADYSTVPTPAPGGA